jgi:hypothetical protein
LGGGVASANQRPILTISGTPPSGVLTGQSYSFTPTAYDSRPRTLVFAISNRPSWATFSSSSYPAYRPRRTSGHTRTSSSR